MHVSHSFFSFPAWKAKAQPAALAGSAEGRIGADSSQSDCYEVIEYFK